MFASASRFDPPSRFLPIDVPTRPGEGKTGAILYRLFGRGVSPSGPLPLRSWMMLNGVSDIEDFDGLRPVFAGQLGAEWRGFDHCGIVTKALLLRVAAAFLDGAVFSEIDDIFDGMMSRSPDAPKDLRTVEAVVRRFSGHRQIVEWIDRFGEHHGFERTLLLGMTEWVIRRKGILPLRPPHLPWLPYLDRTSWLALQFLGLRMFPPEVAGVFSHFVSEKKARKALHVPDVGDAMVGAVASWQGRVTALVETRRTRVV